MTALAGVDLQRRSAGGADALGVEAGLLVALDDAHRHRLGQGLQRGDRAHQQAGLAGAGAGHQVEGQNAPLGEPAAVVGGEAIVFGEDVLLDLHHLGLAHARRVGARRAMAEVQAPSSPPAACADAGGAASAWARVAWRRPTGAQR
jgi:hypothetical protein